ncbi:MAG: TRAP transporter substrate-binding protein DctP [Fimbriimonadaceae bacterium]|nr:TRAP transporter substrate-binding protein DctP [Alphaproteobacteria bacterium]
MKWKLKGVAASAVLALSMAFSAPLSAAEAVITAVSGFPQGTLFSRNFEAWVLEVNERGKGIVQIDYKGGAPAIGSPFQVVKKVQTGVFGMVSITGAYYTNVLPEADAFKLAERSIQDLRANGGFDYMANLHDEKNLHYLGRHVDFVPFHLYLNKKIEKPDLTGLKIRVSPIYRAFFLERGAEAAQRSSAPEVYSLLERGVVDGYGWPIQGIFDFNWEKVTKYRVDPGFYSADIHVLMAKSVWQSLTTEQQDFLNMMMKELEAKNDSNLDLNEAELARQKEAGLETITFSEEDTQIWLKAAKEAGWASVIEVSPEHGPKLREFFAID